MIDRVQYPSMQKAHVGPATKSNSKVCYEPMANSKNLNTEAPPPLRRMKAIVVAAMVSIGLIGSSAMEAGRAEARPVIAPNGVTIADDRTPFYHHGRRYCWYHAAWRGPGWYWCGYAWHRGFGWSGMNGWHHWHGPRPGYPHGGYHPGGGKPGHGTPSPLPPVGSPGGSNPPAGHPPAGKPLGESKGSIRHFIG